MRPEARRAGRYRFPVWVAVAVVAGLVASVMPLSHDEAFWLAITRKLQAGARLYDGAPASGYLVWPTSRTDRYLDELPSLIDASVAISEDGGLGVDRAAISDEYLPVWDHFAERLEDFPCVVETDGVILRFRADRCPQP